MILHAGGIGDLVQALPALRAVRRRWPDARVTLLGRPQRGRLAQMAGLADAVADVETTGLWHLLGESAPSAALPALFETADILVDFLTGGRLGRALPGREVIAVRSLPPEDWRESAARWLLRQVTPHLDGPDVPIEPELPVSVEALADAQEAPEPAGLRGPFAAIHPGSGAVRKNWPVERFAEVARRLRQERGLGIAWLVGPAEAERGPAPPAEPGDAVLSAWPLVRLAAALAQAELYLGNDSGITHLAAAVHGEGGRRTPTVALFGPTDPQVWAPRGAHVHVVRSSTGPMNGLETEAVWPALRGMSTSGRS